MRYNTRRRQLLDCLEWCLDLGVRYVTVYAFSLDNFKRARAEVDGLMALAHAKLGELLSHAPALTRHAARVRVLGALDALPAAVAAAAARVDAATATHTGPQVNICFAYSGREDMATAAAAVAAGVRSGHLAREDVSGALLEACLYTGSAPPVALLLRTSGESRLSDFLLAQSRGALLCFQDVLWPDFSFRHMAAALLRFQRAAPQLHAAQAAFADAAAGAPAAAWLPLDDRIADDDDDVRAPPPPPPPRLRGCGSEELRYGAAEAALVARFGAPVPWDARRGDGCDDALGARAPASPPPQLQGTGCAADRGAASRRRVATFLAAREAARAAWVAQAAETGVPPPWPPPLPRACACAATGT